MFGVCSLLAVAFQLRIVFPLRLFVSFVVHVHVVGMPAGPNRIYHDQIERLRWYVGSETNMTFVKFTGSMEADSATHLRALLDAVKGEANRQLQGCCHCLRSGAVRSVPLCTPLVAWCCGGFCLHLF